MLTTGADPATDPFSTQPSPDSTPADRSSADSPAYHAPSDASTAFPGITRREFLKFCGALGVLIGAGMSAAPDIAAALERLARRPQVVWSQFQECTGCSVNLLQSRTPQVANLILRTISLNYHEAVMAASGDQAEKAFRDTVDSGDFYWVMEGGIATKIPYAMTVHGRTSMEIAKETYQKAKATICIGSCACYGNVQAARPNPTGCKGLAAFLSEDAGISNPTVVNISRCPGNAEDMLAALTYIVTYKKVPPLDPVGRPTFLYGSLIHDNCERRAHFEAGQFVERFGDQATRDGWCWFKVGCKGPVTYAPCPTTRWNGHQSWCIVNGPCIGCAEPSFWDELTPFSAHVTDISVPGLGGVSGSTIGEVLGIATGAGIAAHLVGQTLTHRLGYGGPREDGEASDPTDMPPGSGPLDMPPRDEPSAGPAGVPPGENPAAAPAAGSSDVGSPATRPAADQPSTDRPPDVGEPPADQPPTDAGSE